MLVCDDSRFANYQMLYIQSRNCRWVKYTLDGSDPLKSGSLYTRPENLINTGTLRIVVAALANSGEILRKTVTYRVKPESRLKIVSDVQNGLYDHDLKIGLYSKEDVDLHYTFGERSPEIFDLVYDGGVAIEAIPNTVKHAVLRIRARDPAHGWAGEYRFFYALDGRRVREDGYDPDSETTPAIGDVLRVHTDGATPSNRPVTIEAESEQGRPIVYEIGFNSIPPEPSALSPRVEKDLTLHVPYGMEASFNLKLASVDEQGRLTHAELTRVDFDRKPPVLPRFSFPPGEKRYDIGIELLLSGEGAFEYEITDNGTIPPDPAEGSPKYDRAIDLKGTPGKAVDYYLKIRARDELGNTSVPFGPFLYRIDLRPPEVLQMSGVRDGGVYNRDIVSLVLSQSDVHIHYTFTDDGSEPPDPSEKSPLANGSLEFPGAAGEVTSYRVKLLPFSHFYQLSGQVQSLTFAIDLKRPQAPRVSGFSEGERYNKPVLVVFQPVDASDTVFVSYTLGMSEPPDPVTFGKPYTEPLVFDVPEGEDTAIELRSVSISESGNRSYPDQYSRFRIDKKPPPDPEISGIPAGGVSREPIRVRLEAVEGQIYYNLTDDGSLPRLPLAHPDNLYTSVIQLLGQDGEQITYKFVARTVDGLGNASSDSSIYSVTIDKKAPDPPPAPDIFEYWDSRRRKTVAVWHVPVDHQLFYRVGSDDSEYLRYTGPIVIDAPTVSLSAYIEDSVGNRSPEAAFASTPERRPEKPLIAGVEQGGIYTRGVKMALSRVEGVIRYELTVDGTIPPDALFDSPEGNATMFFDCRSGESITYRMAVRVYNPSRPELVSDPVYIRFTIDRNPPVAPRVVGIENGGYYLGTQILELTVPEGRIFYRLTRRNEQQRETTPSGFGPYKGMITLPGRDGEVTSYRMEAYSVDEAGNRSRSLRSLAISIDRKAIYVSLAGDDNQDGTRERPFRSLEKGLLTSLETGRKILYLSRGEFLLGQSLQMAGVAEAGAVKAGSLMLQG